MWRLILLGLVVMVIGQDGPLENFEQRLQNRVTVNMDPNLVLASIAKVLAGHKKDFDDKFESLEGKCQQSSQEQEIEMITEEVDDKVKKLVEQFVDKLLRFSEDLVQEVETTIVGSLDDALADIDDKLRPVNNEISVLKNRLSTLVTQDEVADLQNKLTSLAKTSAEELREEVIKLPTKDDLNSHSNKVSNQLLDITHLIGNLTTCQDSESVQEVLKQVTDSGQNLGELSDLVRNSSESSEVNALYDSIAINLENLFESMEKNQKSMESFGENLGTIQDTVSTGFVELENLAQTIIETLPEPEAISTTTTTPAPTTTEDPPECVDSTFVGAGRSLDVCSAAVRFRKCTLDFVAYHCCRSCTDAGQISTVPNLKLPRTVPVLQALKSLRPG